MKKIKKLKTSKKGMPLMSQMTGNNYLVYKWYDHGNGNIEALEKEQVSLQVALDRYQEMKKES